MKKPRHVLQIAGMTIQVMIDEETRRFHVDWEPRYPDHKQLAAVLPTYRAWRHKILSEVAERTGKDALVINVSN